MSVRRERKLIEAQAELGNMLGHVLHDWRPTVKVEHQITYGVKPKPTRVDVVILNDVGERWQLPGMNITPGMKYYKLPVFPIEFLVRSSETVKEHPALLAALGQGSITLEFDW